MKPGPVINKLIPLQMPIMKDMMKGRWPMNRAPDTQMLRLTLPNVTQTAPKAPSLYRIASSMYVTIAPTWSINQMRYLLSTYLLISKYRSPVSRGSILSLEVCPAAGSSLSFRNPYQANSDWYFSSKAAQDNESWDQSNADPSIVTKFAV